MHIINYEYLQDYTTKQAVNVNYPIPNVSRETTEKKHCTWVR